MATRIGVDIGGTFTDLIYYDDVSGESLVAKVPTTPDNPDEGVVTAIGQAVPADRVQAAEYFLHGTTVGINALLQRRGAVFGGVEGEGSEVALAFFGELLPAQLQVLAGIVGFAGRGGEVLDVGDGLAVGDGDGTGGAAHGLEVVRVGAG